MASSSRNIMAQLSKMNVLVFGLTQDKLLTSICGILPPPAHFIGPEQTRTHFEFHSSNQTASAINKKPKPKINAIILTLDPKDQDIIRENQYWTEANKTAALEKIEKMQSDELKAITIPGRKDASDAEKKAYLKIPILTKAGDLQTNLTQSTPTIDELKKSYPSTPIIYAIATDIKKEDIPELKNIDDKLIIKLEALNDTYTFKPGVNSAIVNLQPLDKKHFYTEIMKHIESFLQNKKAKQLDNPASFQQQSAGPGLPPPPSAAIQEKSNKEEMNEKTLSSPPKFSR